MSVVDASILVELIVAPDDRPSQWLRGLLDGDDLYWVPGLTPLEVASALRKLVARGQVDADLAGEGLRWLSALVVKMTPGAEQSDRTLAEERTVRWACGSFEELPQGWTRQCSVGTGIGLLLRSTAISNASPSLSRRVKAIGSAMCFSCDPPRSSGSMCSTTWISVRTCARP